MGPTPEYVPVRRHPERGSDDRATIAAILDEAVVCHLGYLRETAEGLRPVVVPTLYGRDGDALILHGSAASRAMRAGAAGLPVCVTVTLLDGLVLARSVFHHSANYRSVVVHGEATPVQEPAAKLRALEILTDHVAPGRWDEARQPTDEELRATTVLRLPLTHAVAKVRTGGVADAPEDLDLPVWAGVVPVHTLLGCAEPAADSAAALPAPAWAADGAVTAPAALTPLAARRGGDPR